MLIGLWLPFSPLASYFGLQALPSAFYPWLLAFLIGYYVLTSFDEALLCTPVWLATKVTRIELTFGSGPKRNGALLVAG
jgi:uncharacterized membrane protein (DUF485 family)